MVTPEAIHTLKQKLDEASRKNQIVQECIEALETINSLESFIVARDNLRHAVEQQQALLNEILALL